MSSSSAQAEVETTEVQRDFSLLTQNLILFSDLFPPQVGFLSSGKVVALDVTYYSNAGNSLDLSMSVSIILTSLDRALTCLQGILMLFPAYLWSDPGTCSFPHGKLLQSAECARPRFPVLHPPAIQHGL